MTGLTKVEDKLNTDLHPCFDPVQFLGVTRRETTSLVAVGKGVLWEVRYDETDQTRTPTMLIDLL